MANDFKVPNLGENVEEGDIVKVMVSEGDEIAADQNVMEIETGKAVVELPCPFGGKVVKVHVQEGSKVKVGDPLLTVEGADGKTEKKEATKKEAATPKAEDEAAEAQADQTEEATEQEVEEIAAKVEDPKPAKTAAKKPAVKAAPKETAPTSAPTAAPGKTPPAGPATRRLARELGVDLAVVAGSGPNGRITEEDVKAAVREKVSAPRAAAHVAPGAPLPAGTDERDTWGVVRRSKVTAMRKAIAVNMAGSHSTIPHVTNFDDADITELERIRKGGLSDYVGTDIKLTMMPFVMKAIAQALRLHPLVNASIDMQKEEIIYKQYVNIGVAVDTERGLVVPVIRDVDRMSIPAIAKALTETTEKARAAKFSLEDLKGGTFTISNLGAVGGTYSTPIINPPEVAVLLLGRSRKLPIVGEGDKIDIRLMMPLSLSYDHRLVDGATAARFLNEVISYLKVPGRLLLAP